MRSLKRLLSCIVILLLGTALIRVLRPQQGFQASLISLHRTVKLATNHVNITTTTIRHNKVLQGLFESVNAKPAKRIARDQFNNRCPHLRKPRVGLLKPWRGIWHNLTWNRAGEVRVQNFYTAVVDGREAAGPIPHLRLLAVGQPFDTHVYCQVWFAHLSHCHVVKATATKNANGQNIRGIFYGQYVWSCPLGDLNDSTIMKIDKVSMVTEQCVQPENLIPVVIPRKGKWEVEFGLCVSISYWDIDPVRISEWVEIHRLLGVSEINIHTADMSKRTNDILKYYKKLGYVKINELISPVAGEEESRLMLLSTVALNDCTWRNMYRYHYTVIVDFDEVITPRRKITYHELLKDVDNSHKFPQPAASYTFRNTYFWVGCASNNTYKKKDVPSYIFRYQSREPHNIFLYASKSIINPRKCLSVFNHYCLVHMPHRPEPWTIDVSPRFALSHHYRHRHNGVTCEQVSKRATIADTIMDRYKAEIHNSVSKALQLYTKH